MIDRPEGDTSVVADEGDVEACVHVGRFHRGRSIFDEDSRSLQTLLDEVGRAVDTTSAEVSPVPCGIVVAGSVRLGGEEPSQAGRYQRELGVEGPVREVSVDYEAAA